MSSKLYGTLYFRNNKEKYEMEYVGKKDDKDS